MPMRAASGENPFVVFRDTELAADREEWVTLRPNMQRDRAKAYDMNGSYKVKDIVEHPLFGLGVVQRVVANKVEILFEQGRKLLRCK